jgi:hypothetical protein
MRKHVLATVVSVAMAAMGSASAAKAAVYNYTFQSSDNLLTVTGTMTVDANNQITGMTGTISGLVNQTITGVVADPTFPTYSTSSDGAFWYNDLYVGGTQALDTYGPLITTAQNPTGYWNLWYNSPGNYSLYESVTPPGGGFYYAIQETGFLSVPAPEPGQGLPALLGLTALLACVRRGRAGPGLARGA